MQSLIKIIFVVLAMYGLTHLLLGMDVEFRSVDYWDNHGFWFLFFIAVFPRLTLLFSSVVSGGFFWWLAWLFAPRYLVAVLATVAYWNTNKFLVVMSWLFAFGGESSEKYVVHKQTKKWRGKTIDAEYTVVS